MKTFFLSLAGASLAGLGLAACVPAGTRAAANAPEGRSPELPAPRPFTGADARAAFESVLAEDSSAALILFLARDPQGPFAAEARTRLATRRQPDPYPEVLRQAGADADVVAAFDAARLSGDPARLRAFAGTHRGHPLADEALRMAR